MSKADVVDVDRSIVDDLSAVFASVAGGEEGETLRRLASETPQDWLEEALRSTGTASIRRRKIPAKLVVWAVIGMCLWAHWPIFAVVDPLEACASRGVSDRPNPREYGETREARTLVKAAA